MSKFLKVLSLGLSLVYLSGCGLLNRGAEDGEGDLIGAQDRPEFNPQDVPVGMVPCPGGTFHMGQTEQDIAASMSNMNKQVTIRGFYMDETEITNNEYRQFELALRDSVENSVTGYTVDSLKRYYPDTTVWMRDFTYTMGDPMVQYYYSHPAFDGYPVVGVSWESAKAFCDWRTKLKTGYNTENELAVSPNFRLPSEAEWEYAARGGRDMATYPWGGPYMRNAKGCMLANFKPGRGDYYSDGYSYTAPVGKYLPNDFGLYDMAGNAAEWCEDAYSDAAVPIVWDLNPTYYKTDEPRKLVRGGSWKDVEYFLQTGTRSFEFQDSSRSYIGFRCAIIMLGDTEDQRF